MNEQHMKGQHMKGQHMNELYQIQKITDRISRIVYPGKTFGYLVTGTERAILIDTGLGLGELRPFVEAQLKGLPLEVILTHGHVDHAGGAIEFDRVWLNARDLDIARLGTTKESRSRYLRGNVPADFVFTNDDLVDPKPVEEYLPLEYGQKFELGGETLEIVCLGGHTPGSIGVLFHEARILLTGDACCSWTLIFGTQRSLTISEFLANLEAVDRDYSDAFDTLLYSHPHNVGGKEVLYEMIEDCRDILAGKDAHLAREMMGNAAFLARVPDDTRTDGKPVNIHYFAESAR